MPSAISTTAINITRRSSMSLGGGRGVAAFMTRAPRSGRRRRVCPRQSRTRHTASTEPLVRRRLISPRERGQVGGSSHNPGRRDHGTTISAIHRAMAYVPPKGGMARPYRNRRKQNCRLPDKTGPRGDAVGPNVAHSTTWGLCFPTRQNAPATFTGCALLAVAVFLIVRAYREPS
jgi:hypothetical protein